MSQYPPSPDVPPVGPSATVPPPPAKSKRKWLLGLGIGCGVTLLVCCGGLALFGVWFTNEMKRGYSTDHAVVEARKTEITAITLPPEFQPAASFDWTMPLANKHVLTWVAYEEKTDKDEYQNLIVLGQFYGEVPEKSREKLLDQINQSIQEQELNHEQVTIDKQTAETREFTIRGEQAEFVFQKGKGSASDKEYRIVLGEFKGSGGLALLYIRVEADQYDDAALTEIIESIR